MLYLDADDDDDNDNLAQSTYIKSIITSNVELGTRSELKKT